MTKLALVWTADRALTVYELRHSDGYTPEQFADYIDPDQLDSIIDRWSEIRGAQ